MKLIQICNSTGKTGLTSHRATIQNAIKSCAIYGRSNIISYTGMLEYNPVTKSREGKEKSWDFNLLNENCLNLGVFFEYRIIEENGQIRIKRLKAEDCVFSISLKIQGQ